MDSWLEILIFAESARAFDEIIPENNVVDKPEALLRDRYGSFRIPHAANLNLILRLQRIRWVWKSACVLMHISRRLHQHLHVSICSRECRNDERYPSVDRRRGSSIVKIPSVVIRYI